jgi:ectoine hydroxylase-related dioxygenase (phytanoyl-CoA dioxygenase family)
MVTVISNVLNDFELTSLRDECDLYSANYTLDSYQNSSCAIDLFEDVSLSDHDLARINEESYFQKRWMDRSLNYSLENSKKKMIQNLLLKKLPQVLEILTHPNELFLFNEHYVVKPPESNIVFRWHRDIDEQLQSCLSVSDVKYYSLWCPLDSTTSENGTLMVPAGTPIQTFSLDSFLSSTTAVEIPIPSTDEDGRTDAQDDEQSLKEGIPIIAPAGSVVIFSSHLLHCSGPNTTSQPRRVFYSQYSEAVITINSSSSQQQQTPHPPPPPLCFAVPCHLRTQTQPLRICGLEGNKRKYCDCKDLQEAGCGSCEEA